MSAIVPRSLLCHLRVFHCGLWVSHLERIDPVVQMTGFGTLAPQAAIVMAAIPEFAELLPPAMTARAAAVRAEIPAEAEMEVATVRLAMVTLETPALVEAEFPATRAEMATFERPAEPLTVPEAASPETVRLATPAEPLTVVEAVGEARATAASPALAFVPVEGGVISTPTTTYCVAVVGVHP